MKPLSMPLSKIFEKKKKSGMHALSLADISTTKYFKKKSKSLTD